jgi:hypothetical protein
VALGLATALLALLSAVSCRLATEPVGDPVPTFTGRWLEGAWRGEAQAHLFPRAAGDTLLVFGVRPNEVLSLRIPIVGVGTYLLGPQQVQLLVLTGGDVVETTYTGIGPTAGVVEITSYGGPGGVVEGTVSFEARITRAGTFGPPVRFEEGQFRAVVAAVPQVP